MVSGNRLRGPILAMLSILTLVALQARLSTAQQAPRETIDGDPQAWKEVVNAYANLTRAGSFRVLKSGSGGRNAHMWEVVRNPIRLHLVVAETGQELIAVGSQTALGPGRWICASSSNLAAFAIGQLIYRYTPVLPPLGDRLPSLSTLLRDIVIARQADVTIGGEKTSVYKYSVRLPSENIRERLFVLENGLPRRVEVLDSVENTIETVDFQDYGAAIVITMPVCQ